MTVDFLEELDVVPVAEPTYAADLSIQERYEQWRDANPWVIETRELRAS